MNLGLFVRAVCIRGAQHGLQIVGLFFDGPQIVGLFFEGHPQKKLPIHKNSHIVLIIISALNMPSFNPKAL